MTKRATTPIFSIAAITTILLTGCSAAGPNSLTPAVESSSESTAPEAEPVKAPATGDIVDAATATELKDAAEGQRGYPLDDGAFVVVNKLEPLPAVVQADIDAKTAGTVAPFLNDSDNIADADAAVGQAQAYVPKNTGKRVIIARMVHAFENSMTEVTTDFWRTNGGPDSGVHYYSQAEAQAAVEAWLATKDNVALYAVVYVG